MNSHALSILEFPRVLSLVADRAQSSLGAERVRSLTPTLSLEEIRAEHQIVRAVRTLLTAEEPWRPESVPDARSPLARLAVANASLSAADFIPIAGLLSVSRRTRDSLSRDRFAEITLAFISHLTSQLTSDQTLETAIARVIDEDGDVKDDASAALRKIRREMRGAQGELVKLLEKTMASLEPHQRVNDMSVTLRNGRYVIPVRRDAKDTIGGIVHDASSTGGTLFVEPPAAVAAGNRIRELESEEISEIDRILAELTETARPSAEVMSLALEALVELDSLVARARYAQDVAAGSVDFSPAAKGFAITQGRHPLLVAQGIDVVPFDLEMSASERTLLVSGPNTGGKTVLLKALGLLSALAQCGIPVPAASGSMIPIFDDIYADVGDEQSIAASLSTFSAHLKNLSEILLRASGDSLVLIDELGSGTDPVEGAALGGAILETLTRRGAFTVATTHLGALKELPSEVPGVVNASLQFDGVALAPTYRLVKGVPGGSYGISIARRLHLPEDVLRRAEERVPQAERRISTLVDELERRERALTDTERELQEISERASEGLHRVSEREKDVRAREREFEKQSRAEARRYLLEARAEVEAAIRELRSASSDEGAARDARRRVEQLAERHGNELREIERAPEPVGTSKSANGGIDVGDLVEAPALGAKPARVVELRGADAVVAIGSIKLAVPMDSLRKSSATPAPEVRIPVKGALPEVEAKTEIDLRGLRADEIEAQVMHAVDAAVRADLKTIRIIHGKGTGALRERVTEMLKKETRVSAFRLGAWNEGGTGVTVAELG
ncbi:MAG: endonuclease MutS2 [Gemmatimonadota bacterium]|nr:endonuclease MutS2 [Gemmatimonadota bacterium]